MVRHDRYAARAEPADGWGGKKVAYVDTLMWIPTPDLVQRINAVESGEADFTFDATADAYGRLKDNPNVRTEISKPYYWLVTVFNKKKGLFSDEAPNGKKLRQAVLAAIDQEPVTRAAVGRPEFLLGDEGELVHPVVFLRRHVANRLALVPRFLEETPALTGHSLRKRVRGAPRSSWISIHLPQEHILHRFRIPLG